MSDLSLYFRFLGASIRGQMEYRASFVMQAAGHFLITGAEFLGLYALFHRFGSLQGWSMAEVALLYGIINIAFALAEGIGRGFDTFPSLVRSGEFDRLLLRPRSTVFQVAAQEIQLLRVGRLLQGLIVLLWAVGAGQIAWTAPKVGLLLASILGGACVFYGLFVLQSTLAFWTIEGLELWNAVTYGGVETAQYPLTVYRPWFRQFFTFVVPLACMNYLPAQALLGRTDVHGPLSAWTWLAPGIGVVFLGVSLYAWRFGVRHYCSTGS